MGFFSFRKEKLVVSGVRHVLDATLFLYSEQKPDFKCRKWGVSFVRISKPFYSYYFFASARSTASCFCSLIETSDCFSFADHRWLLLPETHRCFHIMILSRQFFPSFSFWVSCVFGLWPLSFPLLQMEASLLLRL